MEISAPTKRRVCSRCQRPLRACYCAALPPVPLRTRYTRVVVLQHTKEQRQRQAISSVPVLAHVLDSPESVAIVPVDVAAGESNEVSSRLCEALRRDLDPLLMTQDAEAIFVLFPHADAKTLTSGLVETLRAQADYQDEETTHSSKSVVLVVVDGTWTEAKKIVHYSQAYWENIATRCHERGMAFEYVCLDSESDNDGAVGTKSIYGELRKEPMEGCVSTLEAVALALRVIEPFSRRLCDTLCDAFRGMVEIQSQFQRQGKAEQLAKHDGTPKPGSVPLSTRSASSDATHVESSGQGVVRPYVFYTTQTDFRKRQRFVLEGDVRVCTRDEAIALCQEMNRDRKRGNRVSALPEDAFQRHQQQQTQKSDFQHDK